MESIADDEIVQKAHFFQTFTTNVDLLMDAINEY